MDIASFNIVGWLINVLFFVLIAIVGFVFKSLYNDIKALYNDIQESNKELTAMKDKNQELFQNKEICNVTHSTINETLNKIENSMSNNFIRLYDKVDSTNGIAEGLKVMGQEMGKEIGKAIKEK
jgi:predicted PurR-regulated permease PerM